MSSETPNESLHIDRNDAGELPVSERIGKASDMFWVWGGVNVAVTNLAIGGIGISIGLSLFEVLIVNIIGGAIGALLMGAVALKGKLTGAAVMVNARPSYGYRGGYFMAAVLFLMSCGWFGINSFFGVTAARSIVDQFGIPVNTTTSIIVLAVIVAVQLIIAVYGYSLIRRFERVAVGALFIVFVIITVFALPQFRWEAAEPLQGSAHIGMIVFWFTLLGAGWAISWTPWAHDFGRYVNPDESDKSTFWSAWAGMYLVNLFVMTLGAGVVSFGASPLDVGSIVNRVVGGGWSIPLLLIMTLGLISANVVPLFSGGFALQTMGIRLARTKGTLLTGIIGLPIPIIGIFSGQFATIFDQFMLTLLVWITPWLAVTLVDFFLIHRRSYSRADLYESGTTPAGQIFIPGIVAYLVGLAASIPFANTPIWTSPLVSNYLGGADVSYWVGGLVAALIYYPWAKSLKSRGRGETRIASETGAFDGAATEHGTRARDVRGRG